MLPNFKGKSIPVPTRSVTSKFKVYSENSKVVGRGRGNADANSSRMSTLSKKDSLPSSQTTLKGRDLVTGAVGTKVHDLLGKAKVGRKALADVSNIRQNSFRAEKPGSYRNSMSFATSTSAALSNRPPLGKVKGSAAGVTVSRSSVKFSTMSVRTSSSSGMVKADGIVHNLTRKNNANTRNSFPVMKKPSQLGSSDLKSQGDIRSADKSTKKIGFLVKTRVGGASHLKTKVTNDSASDGFMRITHRNKTTTDALQAQRKSVKPSSRTSLQTYFAQRNSKSKSINGLDKSVGVTSGRRVKVGTSFVKEEVMKGATSSEGSDTMKPQMLETVSSKKCTRRKSYTSELIHRSKYIEAEKEETLPNIDDQGNPLEVAEYVDDIYQYYWVVEMQSTSLENYMMIQTDIRPQMRSILINWLLEVHFKFDLMPETLYLAAALLDRYLSLVSVTKTDLQLVGLTSLLLASKYEDFWHPRVKDLISISAESYTRKQILEMEKDILKKLKFRLNLPTAYVFMLRFLKASKSEKKLEHLAFYIIELCLIDYEVLKFRPSLLCASAVYVARCTLHKSPAWTPLLSKHARYDESQIRECSQKVLAIHKAASSSLLRVTHDKYNRPEFGRVAAVKPLACLP